LVISVVGLFLKVGAMIRLGLTKDDVWFTKDSAHYEFFESRQGPWYKPKSRKVSVLPIVVVGYSLFNIYNLFIIFYSGVAVVTMKCHPGRSWPGKAMSMAHHVSDSSHLKKRFELYI